MQSKNMYVKILKGKLIYDIENVTYFTKMNFSNTLLGEFKY